MFDPWLGSLDSTCLVAKKPSRGSAGEYQAHVQAGVARLRWRHEKIGAQSQ